MKKCKSIVFLIIGIMACLNTTSCSDIYYVDDNDCIGTWFVTYNYDQWGRYDDGGIMDLYSNGQYFYYFSERDYIYGRLGYSGRWWTDRDNLIYTYGPDTYSYRVTYNTFNELRLRNNLPPGDVEIWYRY